MDTPASLPENTEASPSAVDQAVSSQPAESVEAGSGMQSQAPRPDDMSNWSQKQWETWFQDGAPGSEETPVAETAVVDPETPEEPTEVEPEPETEAQEEETPAETEPEPKGKTKIGPQYRIQPVDDTDAKVLALRKSNPGMTLAAALYQVTGQVIHPQAPAAQAEPAKAETPAAVIDPGPTVESIDARQAEALKELQAAYTEMDFEKVGAIQVELHQLGEQKNTAVRKQAEAAHAGKVAWEQECDKFEAQAIALYPTAAAPNSALHQQILALEAELERNNDPILNRSDAVLRITQMAAAQLAIAPSTVKAVSTPPPAKAAPQPVPAKVRPAAVNSSHGAVNQPAQAELVAEMGNWTAEQWEAYQNKL